MSRDQAVNDFVAHCALRNISISPPKGDIVDRKLCACFIVENVMIGKADEVVLCGENLILRSAGTVCKYRPLGFALQFEPTCIIDVQDAIETYLKTQDIPFSLGRHRDVMQEYCMRRYVNYKVDAADSRELGFAPVEISVSGSHKCITHVKDPEIVFRDEKQRKTILFCDLQSVRKNIRRFIARQTI